ncbi:anhydro-N-acetylmuramic acid kinase [Loktanella ponticola]|uniref:Anhydro-N-acetylmuramic acid kinase n=1 Tax=Yoonia ponticola TaxID=1524255 RepID=A0A7W9BJH3_9RHOB|nr:anhydro-N-acetylmuramic acid kinase [Yoonia ponticola]MBB5721654.1 anhydro-N-acetylmuramic acid kinase [Yoonia ponticola]
MLKTGRIRAVGAMSGTSLDGVDAAEIVTDGVSVFEFGPTAYRAYSDQERAVLRGGLGKWQEDDLGDLPELIETTHAQILHDFKDAEVVGFHGQTLSHDPHGRGTHQCGDGAVLAEVLGKPVVWDFRSADVRLGGEGAPLAPFFHFALAKYIKAVAPIAFLNLGGVGNLTWIDPTAEKPNDDRALLAFDTGPANAPLNDLMQLRLGLSCDVGGALAAQGDVADDVVERFLNHSYFHKIPPKSLDRDAFIGLAAEVADLSDADAAATLTAVCAMSVAQSMTHCPSTPSKVLATGGGRHNPTLMAMLSAGLECPVVPVEDVGLDGDMLEAQAFAYLAVRVARGLPTSCRTTTGVKAAVSGGTLSRPVSST